MPFQCFVKRNRQQKIFQYFNNFLFNFADRMIFFTKAANCTITLRSEFDMGIDITGNHKHGIQRFDTEVRILLLEDLTLNMITSVRFY